MYYGVGGSVIWVRPFQFKGDYIPAGETRDGILIGLLGDFFY